MDTTSLFTAALQLPDPWRVSGVEFRDEAATGGVGAIEKYLVVDPLVVAGGGVRHINEPAPLEAPLHGGAANTVSFG